MSSPTLLSKYPFPPVDGRLPEILFSETIEELQTVSRSFICKKHESTYYQFPYIFLFMYILRFSFLGPYPNWGFGEKLYLI